MVHADGSVRLTEIGEYLAARDAGAEAGVEAMIDREMRTVALLEARGQGARVEEARLR